ncbi:citrate synthase [Heyndrickxia ginsengihumi]|uniref:Citrate synthase n=1 Tax=Heyndrickxia coagulans TaxID=1398 RepID=CISY_HEYCO|nr:citrate synthase [Heyndrickxia ginsengihumi]P27660.1 RecName: Full=Citrate synthase [Heyndrickxia coagulans]pir/A43936/ citrate (si)-synthase (EC 4.1.3.7) [validated] - Bacillus sp. (ATCC 55182) [Bacillus sp. (in: firmicutes)]AAA52231.1 citrate synthase [Heyndrickxia coagulans]MCM3023927.1 citrate synthase [Heyndrickxia ginsengihumi]
MVNTNQFIPGLEGVIASETKISFLDTVNSEIVIKGYDLLALSKTKGYLDIVHLLLEGTIPNEAEKQHLEETLKQEYDVPDEIIQVLSLLPKTAHPMDALRTGVSVLASFDTELLNREHSTNLKRAYQLLGKIPNIVANSYHILHSEEPVQPLQDLSYSANFLYMITGKKPTELEEKIFDRSLVLYSEHELPNSTFTARVIASTLSDLYGALTGAVASLKGHLHGGANEAVMEMLQDAQTVEGFKHLLHDKLSKKEKIMGFGHRVYMKKMDPRAAMMKEALKELSAVNGDDLLLQMCEAGEQIMREEKGLFPNLDYYAAPVYWKLGIPIPLYTPIFFSSRTVGLCAHVMEQHENNRIFRPRVLYTGARNLRVED